MSSVVERIEEIQKNDRLKQPRGGYLKPSLFTKVQLNNEEQLYDEENISSALIGTVVDYLTRYVYSSQFCVKREDDDYVECGMKIFDDVFGSVFIAAKIAEKIMKKDYTESTDSISAKFCQMTVFSNPISELTDEFIILTTKFISLDAFRRNPMSAILSAKIDEINPDYKTIHNIRVMVERSIDFFNYIIYH